MVVILRRLGNISENWTYKMDEKNTTIVQKIKLHWDQSKSIFKPENLKDLEHIVKLAVRTQPGQLMDVIPKAIHSLH